MKVTKVEEILREIEKLAWNKVSGEHCSSDADWNIVLTGINDILRMFSVDREEMWRYRNLVSKR